MKTSLATFARPFLSRVSCLVLACAAGLVMGCAGGGPMLRSPGTPSAGRTTSVMVLATSTANDRLSEFNINFTSITLTSQSGATATLLAHPTSVEFMHLNGAAEPVVTASVPQGVYGSATATIARASFTCIGLNGGGGLMLSTDDYVETPSSQITVNLPGPITITGTSMVLSLDMLVSKSATYSSCEQDSGAASYSINPTFNLVPVSVASPPMNIQNGKLTGLDGLIASISAGGSSLTVMSGDGDSCVSAAGQACAPGTANGAVWHVTADGNTVFQGVANLSALAAGMPVDMDATIQPDGSLLASRIAIADTNTTDLSVFRGTALQVAGLEPVAYLFGREQQGYLFGAGPVVNGPGPFRFSNATFQTSGQFTNLQSLPFSASFQAANIFAGQNVSYTTHARTDPGGPGYDAAATVTLLPQTINGTVSAVSTDGGFDTYTVTLAPYDLIPDLAVQTGQITRSNNPNTVVVYVDTDTEQLNSSPLVVGSVLRFNGLLFDDHGTLKMDCDWVNDGVAE